MDWFSKSLDLDTGKYDEARETGLARRYITYWLLGILSATVVFSFVALAWSLSSAPGSAEKNFDHTIGLLNVIFGPVVTLVSTATGFYFGAQTARAGRTDAQAPRIGDGAGDGELP